MCLDAVPIILYATYMTFFSLSPTCVCVHACLDNYKYGRKHTVCVVFPDIELQCEFERVNVPLAQCVHTYSPAILKVLVILCTSIKMSNRHYLTVSMSMKYCTVN